MDLLEKKKRLSSGWVAWFSITKLVSSEIVIFRFLDLRISIKPTLCFAQSTYAGHKYSALSLRSSPYPNFLRTVHVVSCLPLWINSACRNKKPGQRKTATKGIRKQFNCLHSTLQAICYKHLSHSWPICYLCPTYTREIKVEIKLIFEDTKPPSLKKNVYFQGQCVLRVS